MQFLKCNFEIVDFSSFDVYLLSMQVQTVVQECTFIALLKYLLNVRYKELRLSDYPCNNKHTYNSYIIHNIQLPSCIFQHYTIIADFSSPFFLFNYNYLLFSHTQNRLV